MKLKELNGKYYQRCDVVMLPTAQPPYKMPYDKHIPESNLILGLEESLNYSRTLGFKKSPDEDLFPSLHSIGNYSKQMYQHLYILSSEEIKEGDGYYFSKSSSVHKHLGTLSLDKSKHDGDKCYKIIATTDESLVLHNNTAFAKLLPQPPLEFIKAYIEAYNKGEKIEKVLVEYDLSMGYCTNCGAYQLASYVVCNYNGICKGKVIPTHRLKINSSNEITIKKVKKSWTREEVVVNCLKMQHDYSKYKEGCHFGPNMREIADWTDKWIKENL